MMSKWSNNIRNNAGYLNRCDPSTQFDIDKLFHQHGRRVFKDVVPLAAKFITEHLASHDLTPDKIGRFWLHQANQKLNELVAEYVLGRKATKVESPIILDEYGNTASAGSLLAFSMHNEDLPTGTLAIMSSFGAGYSLASLLLRRI
jgi:beta-ketodecanoyl-[acyl-carrier-protein] synthase